MGVRYPGPVSRHNLVCPLLLYGSRSPCGIVDVLATTVVIVSFVDTGPPRTYPKGELVGVAGRVSWQ